VKALCASLLLAFAAGCATKPVTDEERRCSEGLDAVGAEFKQAQISRFADNLTLLKASALLNAALAQKQFGKYAACLEKIERARVYIADAQKR
jgi:hypothetical protein